MPIPTLPTAPDPNDPATFNSRASAWVAALDAWTAAVNALPAITATYAFTDGTSSAPSVAFASDTNTGMFKVAGDKLGFAAGGATCLSISQSGIDSDYPARFKAPADTWTSSGAFFGVAGVSSMSGQLSSEGGNAVHLTSNGYRDNTAGTNLWRSHGVAGLVGAAQIALSPTGFVSLRAQITKNTGDAFEVTEVARAFGSGQLGVLDGTAGAPTYSFIADLDNGMFRPTGNVIAFSTGGIEAFRLSAAQAALATGLGGLGYGTGAGGAALQLTSKSTGVTLSKPSGVITTHNAALAAGASVQFTVTNSVVVATDSIAPSVQSPTGKYMVDCVGVSAGSYILRLENITAGSLSEAVLINVPVVKNVNS